MIAILSRVGVVCTASILPYNILSGELMRTRSTGDGDLF